MVIVDFGSLTAVQYTEAAGVLREALAHLPSGYQGPGEAEDEVKLRCTEEDWLGYAALDGERLVGWIGALKSYPRGWEIHPLVVAPDRQRCGIGSALLGALEAVARRADVLTLFLGSDDDYGGTNLFGRDLHQDDRGDGAQSCPHLLSPSRLRDRRAAARCERRGMSRYPAGQATCGFMGGLTASRN
jgi:aminoglycoside 6'-N-acetyltransferase I